MDIRVIRVIRVFRARTDCYLIATREGLTLVDAGLPRMWPDLCAALGQIGAVPGDIDAVVLTHGHFDHVGMAARIQRGGAQVLVHERDRDLARHPYRYAHEAARWTYPFRHPQDLGPLAAMAAAGALWVRGVDAAPDVVPGRPLDVPGRPVPVFSPGHTFGHCAFLLDDGTLFSGDALVTLDPYTGRHGPRIVARAATADSAEALASLDALGATGARRLLPGHGDPWDAPVAEAVRLARLAGVD